KQLTVIENQQCVISVCAKASRQHMRKVTDWILGSAQDNQTLPAYLKVNDIVCQWCYNRIIIHSSVVMKEYAKAIYSVRSKCLNQLGQKCPPCLEFLKNGIQINIQESSSTGQVDEDDEPIVVNSINN
ncbi:32111_t:CDS:2, partial [Racocetra persica]